MNTLTLTPGVLSCTPDAPPSTIELIMEPINNAIMNDGDIIYNGSDEPFDCPVLIKTRSIFRDYYEEGSALTNYPNASSITLVEIDRIGASHIESILRKHLSSKTVDVWRSCKSSKTFPDFTTNAVAIHVDDKDGTWFEFIVNGIAA